MAESTKKAPPAPELFKICSLVRDVSTRIHRAKSPTRHRFNLLLGGGLVRVTRKRPATVTKSMVLRMQPELLDKEARGMLMLTNMIGQRVSIETLAVVGSLPPEAPLPTPPLDSAATDHAYPVGEPKPMFLGGLTSDQEVEVPEVIKPDLPEGEDDEELADGEEEESMEPETVPGDPNQPEEPALLKRKRGRRR